MSNQPIREIKSDSPALDKFVNMFETMLDQCDKLADEEAKCSGVSPNYFDAIVKPQIVEIRNDIISRLYP